MASRAPTDHISSISMRSFALPPAAAPADIPRLLRPQIVSPCAAPPDGNGWPHESKHDGHRLLAIITGRRAQAVEPQWL